MGERTGISWTDHTANFWQGCHKVGAGCKNCYMYRDKKRYGQDPNVVVRSSDATFYAPAKWEAGRVFVCSWSDFFIEEADAWRDDAWGVIRQAPHLIWQILTKRPENMASRLPPDWGRGWGNVHLAVSVENQAAADERIPVLLQTPAAMRFLSVEPMLGPVDLSPYLAVERLQMPWGLHWTEKTGQVSGLSWCIVGGESGPGFRPMDEQWVRDLRDQCQAAGVSFFYKQPAGLRPGGSALLDGREWRNFPEVPV